MIGIVCAYFFKSIYQNTSRGFKKHRVSLKQEKEMKMKRKLFQNQKGQGVMEYVILTGLVGIFCLAAVKKFGTTLDNRLGQIQKKIQNEIVIKR